MATARGLPMTAQLANGKVLAAGDFDLVPAPYSALASAGLNTPRPTVTSVAPLGGLPAGGTTVTITGTGLTAVTAVSFGAVAGTNVVHDPTSPDTKLTVRSPAGTVGTSVDITVSSPGGVSAIVPADRFAFGLRQVVANFDGDSKTDISVFRPSDAVWFIHNSGGGDPFISDGSPGDVPVPGDYDGDGAADHRNPALSIAETPQLASGESGLVASLRGDHAVTSLPRSSATATGSSHDGQHPPMPTRRMNVRQSSHRCSPTARAPHPSHS